MATPRLYFIGDRFGLHHGIQFGYGDFKVFVRDQGSHLFWTVKRCLSAGQN
jgi:hypothetical protein